MTNDEQYLSKRVGKPNGFKVPEGYFQQLTSQVMSAIPEQTAAEQQPVAKTLQLTPRRRWWMSVAACIVAVLFSATVYMWQQDVADESSALATAAVSDSYIDEATDYAMLDNIEIYSYLADAEL